MLPVIGVVLFALISITSSAKHTLPSYIHPCDLAEDGFTECVKEQMIATLPYFTKGIPEMGVPSLDPVQLDDIIIDGKGLKLTLTNASMYGINTSKITNLRLDIGKEDEVFNLKFKANMSVKGKYTVDGRILILPIQGKGDATIEVTNVEVQIDSKLVHVRDKHKGLHLKLNAPMYNYTIEKTTFNFENLFNGNKQLADATHQFANENWKQLMDDLAPPAIKQIVKTCVKAINKFFSHATIQEMVKNYNDTSSS